MKRWLVLLAACGGGSSDSPLIDATHGGDAISDAMPTCSVVVAFDPPTPLAYSGSRVRATANVSGAPGVVDYTWQIRRGSTQQLVTHEPGALDGSAVDFLAETADSYDAMVQVNGSTPCNVTPYTVNVEAPGANTAQLRIRVFPPASMTAPPMEKRVLVKGNTASWAIGVIPVDPGATTTGSTGAQAYVRFIPQAARDMILETFTDTAGAYSVRLVNQLHDVLVVPLVPGLAPRLVKDWLPGEALALGAGTSITGVVRDHDNALLAGAKVQLVIDGVPTSLATTDGNGAFTVHAQGTTGAATIEVTAPAESGLPRLVASSAGWNLATPIQVKYEDTIEIRDVGGAVVRRNGAALASARVTLVGSFDAGTITAGTQVAAIGEVRAAAVANGAGALPSLRAPNRLLHAVTIVEPVAADIALSTVNLAGAAPASIDAPAPMLVATQLRNATGPLPGAVFEAVPRDVLAMAGIAPLRFVADANGTAGGPLANGRYDFRFVDPRGHEMARLAAPHVEKDKAPGELAASYVLPKALKVRGSLSLSGNPAPVGRAAVQILCATGVDCIGAGRTVPLAEGPSANDGRFEVGVLDPGTM